MPSTAGGIVSWVAVGFYPLAGLSPPYGKRRGMESSKIEATTAEHYPMDFREAMGCRLCLGLIHELQMGDVTGSIAPCHLVNEFASDASQFEAQQTAHHVIT